MKKHAQVFIEELSLNAWPAMHTVIDEGWVIRLSDGYTKRANSVSPLYGPTAGLHSDELLAPRVDRAADVYASSGLPAIFKVPSGAPWASLDSFLDRSGYARIDETSVQTRSLGIPVAQATVPDGFELRVEEGFGEPWIRSFASAAGVREAQEPAMRAILAGIKHPVLVASVREKGSGGQGVGFAFGVRERGYVGLFDVSVAEPFRRLGLARAIVTAILSRARDAGSHTAYLQVVKGNAKAESLYRSIGYREAYSYWYRRSGPAR